MSDSAVERERSGVASDGQGLEGIQKAYHQGFVHHHTLIYRAKKYAPEA